MNRRITYVLLLIVLVASALINESHAQSRYNSGLLEIAKKNAESLVVFTDRSMYAVNEPIQFSALLQSMEEPYHGLGSKVLYVELINSIGEAVAQRKYLISENRSSGQLSIPSNLLSGYYYLRCYTRWMRNFGPRNFSYTSLIVVSPYTSEVAEGKITSGHYQFQAIPKGKETIFSSMTKSTYISGETIDVEFSIKEGIKEYVEHACITVVPFGAIDTSSFLYELDSKTDIRTQFQFVFLPELQGTSISGVVCDQNNQVPASNVRIHFSVLGEQQAYFVTHADQEGRFAINTPFLTGLQEIFVVPEFQTANPIEVRIDKDFETEPLTFQTESLKLQHDEQVLASRLSLHMQLQKEFEGEPVKDTTDLPDQYEHTPFYRKPEISVEIDEFINLPNMEEVFANLVPRAFVIKRGGREYFLITSEDPMISMFPPLIMIDHIPVFDTESILAIPPSRIDRIEVIPEVFIKGEAKYGGIISFISRQKDLAGISLPEGSYYFDFTAFQPSSETLNVKSAGPGKIPDTRNTLFWMDHLHLQRDSSSKVSFQAASVPGTYLILFRGVSSDGNIVYGLNSFEVE